MRKTAYIRFNGLGNWSLSNAGQVSSFFASKFGRVLPVSAFGQSELHNRWGLTTTTRWTLPYTPIAVKVRR